MVVFTKPIFASVCVCHTDFSGGGVGRGDGGWDGPAKQSECPFTGEQFLRLLSASQSSEHFYLK